MVKTILLFHVAGLGDFVEFLGVLKSIRDTYKSDKILLVVSEKVFELAQKLKFIDEVYKWPTKKGYAFDLTKIFHYVFILLKLRNYKFDIFVNSYEIGSRRGSLMLKLLIKFLKPKISVGINTNNLGYFFDKKVNIDKKTSIYDYYCALADTLGVRVKYKNAEVIKELFSTEVQLFDLPKNKKIISLGVGAERKTRMWLAENFAEVINYLLSRDKNMEIFLLGGNQHLQFANKILGFVNYEFRSQVKNLCGKTSLEHLFYILKNSTLVISNDSAIMHISATLGIKTIGIIGPGDPYRSRPYFEVEDKVLLLWQHVGCNPCYFYKCPNKTEDYMKCVKIITPEEVIKAIHKLQIL